MSERETKPIHCKCGLLDGVLDDPESPIKFDHEYLEYSLQCGATEWCVHYCPFCGETLRKSLRVFYEITKEEEARLRALIAGCETRQQIIEKLGQPDWQFPAGSYPIKMGKIVKTQIVKQQYNYKQLSEIAYLRIQIADDGEKIDQISVGQKYYKKATPET